jgi:hypothetical protein
LLTALGVLHEYQENEGLRNGCPAGFSSKKDEIRGKEIVLAAFCDGMDSLISSRFPVPYIT